MLYSETSGRILLEIPPECEKKFAAALKGFPLSKIGQVLDKQTLRFNWDGKTHIETDTNRLRQSWKTGLERALEGGAK